MSNEEQHVTFQFHLIVGIVCVAVVVMIIGALAIGLSSGTPDGPLGSNSASDDAVITNSIEDGLQATEDELAETAGDDAANMTDDEKEHQRIVSIVTGEKGRFYIDANESRGGTDVIVDSKTGVEYMHYYGRDGLTVVYDQDGKPRINEQWAEIHAELGE